MAALTMTQTSGMRRGQYVIEKKNGSNNKQPTSHLGSNDTSNNNGNMETTERTVKESKGVEALLQQMTDGAVCGTSRSTL